MADARRYRLLCAGTPLAVFLFLFVAAPSYLAPGYDLASSAGWPWAVAVILAFWVLLTALGLVAIRQAHGAGALFAVIAGLVVGAMLVLFVTPALIDLIAATIP
jgi:hypothetical protein